MKKKVTLIAALFLFTGFLSAQNIPHTFANEQMAGYTYLLSYPRSGKTWVTYMLRSQYGTSFPDPDTFRKQSEKHNENPYRFTHIFSDLSKVNKSENKLLFLIRNYKESIRRNYLSSTSKAYKDILQQGPQFDIYINNLYLYDSWPEQNRCMIYYEDLIEMPEESFARIVNFLGLDRAALNEFIKDLDSHREACLRIYSNRHGYTASGGDDLLFHTKHYSKKQIVRINEFVKIKHKEMWNKYLKRFD
jgi:hypothetical protein